MKCTTSIMLFLCSFTRLLSQWDEDFSTYHLATWRGDTSQFIISPQKKLQLNAGGPGQSAIFREFEDDSTSEWVFTAEMNFPPSATNRWRVYLAMDTTFTSEAKGYYLEAGENGNEDRWKFYIQDRNRSVLLAQGEAGRMATDPAVASFRCYRRQNLWTVEADYTGKNQYSEKAVFQDSAGILFSRAWFGITCVYTSSRADKFLFDDIHAGRREADTIPPDVKEIRVISKNGIEVTFSENLDPESMISKENYQLEGHGQPVAIRKIDEKRVEMDFSFVLETGRTHQFFYKGLTDLHGNTIHGRKSFVFTNDFIAEPIAGEITITEIMFDPDPAVALPEAEYVEIWNSTNNPLRLDGIRLSDGTTISAAMPAIMAEAGEKVILCPAKDTLYFMAFGKTVGLINMPSLNNDGDQVVLYDRQNNVVDEVIYSSGWHTDPVKKSGGYSLELQRPGQRCKGRMSWGTCNDPAGGTPGRSNSVFDETTDQDPPALTGIFPVSEWEIRLQFDEPLDKKSMEKRDIYTFEPALSMALISAEAPEMNSVLLLLNNPLLPGTEYQVDIHQAADCSGNLSGQLSRRFSLPRTAGPGDLMFNEILFNPVSGGVDYLEIHNNTGSELRTEDLFMCNRTKGDQWTALKSLQTINPGSYLVFSADTGDIRRRYSRHDAEKFQQAGLVSMDDDEGSLYLAFIRQGELILLDSVHYHSDWHNPFIQDREGVSLEKISESARSDDRNNWTSASASSHYGSPGLKNSQTSDTSVLNKDFPCSLDSRVISPDNDGYRDLLIIRFHSGKEGCKANIRLFDPEGDLVRIISQEVIGPEDLISWNGTDEYGSILPSGNYILDIMLVHYDGEVIGYRNYITVDTGRR